MPTEYRCLICGLHTVSTVCFAATVFLSHLALHFLFSCFNSWLEPLNHSVTIPNLHLLLGTTSLYRFFVHSAVDRLRCLWQDLHRLRQGTSPFVVRTPLNIVPWNNYHTICGLLLARCSLSACQHLFSPSFSPSPPPTHAPSHWDGWGAGSLWTKRDTFN